jgi:hypothetical protein
MEESSPLKIMPLKVGVVVHVVEHLPCKLSRSQGQTPVLQKPNKKPHSLSFSYWSSFLKHNSLCTNDFTAWNLTIETALSIRNLIIL